MLIKLSSNIIIKNWLFLGTLKSNVNPLTFIFFQNIFKKFYILNVSKILISLKKLFYFIGTYLKYYRIVYAVSDLFNKYEIYNRFYINSKIYCVKSDIAGLISNFYNLYKRALFPHLVINFNNYKVTWLLLECIKINVPIASISDGFLFLKEHYMFLYWLSGHLNKYSSLYILKLFLNFIFLSIDKLLIYFYKYMKIKYEILWNFFWKVRKFLNVSNFNIYKLRKIFHKKKFFLLYTHYIRTKWNKKIKKVRILNWRKKYKFKIYSFFIKALSLSSRKYYFNMRDTFKYRSFYNLKLVLFSLILRNFLMKSLFFKFRKFKRFIFSKYVKRRSIFIRRNRKRNLFFLGKRLDLRKKLYRMKWILFNILRFKRFFIKLFLKRQKFLTKKIKVFSSKR